MNGGYDEDRLVHLLRRAGTEADLDPMRIRRIVETGAPTGAVRTVPGPLQVLANPVLSFTPGRRMRRGAGGRHHPAQLFALPIAAALATLMVVVMNGTGGPRSDTIERVTGRGDTAVEQPTPTVTSHLVPPMTVTADPSATPSAAGSTAPGGAPASAAGVPGTGGQTGGTASGGQSGGVTVTVTPVQAGQTSTLPLHPSVDWLAVESDGHQAQSVKGGSTLGPVQVGSGQVLESGPFQLNWLQGSANSNAGGAQSWVLVPGSVRGAPSSLRLPARLHQVPGTITLLAGTEGGSGTVTVTFADPAGGVKKAEAVLPSCGDSRCPAVVTISLTSPARISGSAEVMVELTASGESAKVGLAAAELD